MADKRRVIHTQRQETRDVNRPPMIGPSLNRRQFTVSLGRFKERVNIHETCRARRSPPAKSKGVRLRVGEDVANHGLGRGHGESGGDAYMV